MAGIGIIHNPFAKGNLRRPWIADAIRKAIGDVGVVRETKNIDELPQVAKEFMDQGIEIMAVNGGDGTLHLALTAFVNTFAGRPLPKLMSLRGGTMNTVSNSLKIKGKTLAIVKKAVEKYRAQDPFHEMDQHLIKVNEKYGFLSGAGVIASFLDAYYSGGKTGPIQGAKVLGRMILSALTGGEYVQKLFRPAPVTITADGQELEPTEWKLLLACTIRELGLGFKPTPRAYDKPGHFHFLAATADPINLVPKLPAVWLGRDISHPKIHYNGVAAQVIITPREPIRWMVDGEMYDSEGPLHYSVGPTIKIVAP
jgi:diacylglycerol kinase family enzyme